MGRKSTKENKNIYQISRENNGLTRDAAAERLEFISSDRIEKIESEKSNPHPDEILAMAECYKNPSLCNYYCSHECPIGREYVPEVTSKDLSLITLEMLSTLNTLSKEKDRMIEVEWEAQGTDASYEAEIRLITYNRTGLLAEISVMLAAQNVPVSAISGHAYKESTYIFHVSIIIKDTAQLNRIIRELKKWPDVIEVDRVSS